MRKQALKWGWYAVAAYLVFIPLVAPLFERLAGHDLARITQVILGAVCALTLVFSLDCGNGSIKRESVAFGVAMAAMAIASSLHASSPAMAFREAALVAGLLAIALVTSRHRDPALDMPDVSSIAMAVYVGLVLLLAVLSQLAGQPLNHAEIFLGYDNYRFFNHVQSAALPLTVTALMVGTKSTWLRHVAAFAAIGGFALLFAVAGRGTFIGIVAGACLCLGWFRRKSWSLLRGLVITSLYGLLLFALLFFVLPWSLGGKTEFSDTYYGSRLGSVEARLFLWDLAKGYVASSPWLGIGPMHYAHYRNLEAAHPHNVYLQVAAEWGMPLLLLLLVAVARFMYRLGRTIQRCNDERQRTCGVGLFLACWATLIDGMFSGNFVMPVSQVWIACVFGSALAWMGSRQSPPNPLREPKHLGQRRLLATGLLLSQLWLVWTVWPEAIQLEQHIKQIEGTVPNPRTNPRFWSHGWF